MYEPISSDARQKAWEQRRPWTTMFFETKSPERRGGGWILAGVAVGLIALIALPMMPSAPAESRNTQADSDLLYRGVAAARVGGIYAIDQDWRASSHPFQNKVDIPWRIALSKGERVSVLRVKRRVRVYWDWPTKDPHPYDDVNYSLVKSLDDPSKAPSWVIDQNLRELK
jgi:hypothetical protein